MIRFNAQGNLISCADNIQFVSINVLPFKSSSQRSLLLHLYGADSMRANFRELLSGSTIRHCCKKTVHWSQRSCRNSLSLWLWSKRAVRCSSWKGIFKKNEISPFGVDFEICNFVDCFMPKHTLYTLTTIQKVKKHNRTPLNKRTFNKKKPFQFWLYGPYWPWMLVLVSRSADPRLLGALCKTVGGGGWEWMRRICPCFTPSRFALAESARETVSLPRLV